MPCVLLGAATCAESQSRVTAASFEPPVALVSNVGLHHTVTPSRSAYGRRQPLPTSGVRRQEGAVPVRASPSPPPDRSRRKSQAVSGCRPCRADPSCACCSCRLLVSCSGVSARCTLRHSSTYGPPTRRTPASGREPSASNSIAASTTCCHLSAAANVVPSSSSGIHSNSS